MNYDTPIIDIKGVGEKTQKLFAHLGVYNVGDLLTYYPKDYDEFKPPVDIINAESGEICSIYACIAGTIHQKNVRNLNIITINIADKTGQMQLTFFNMPFLKKTL
ncbi:MAG: ATP-dependent DNA helicase RecG, partial [Acetatifactor sp.]|nr:ATP-dependent DNA helicase RecG [Acetatifactor sp.]